MQLALVGDDGAAPLRPADQALGLEGGECLPHHGAGDGELLLQRCLAREQVPGRRSRLSIRPRNAARRSARARASGTRSRWPLGLASTRSD